MFRTLQSNVGKCPKCPYIDVIASDQRERGNLTWFALLWEGLLRRHAPRNDTLLSAFVLGVEAVALEAGVELEAGEAEELRRSRLVSLGFREGVEHHAFLQLGE